MKVHSGSKTGFTLLEVVLSIAIMLWLTTMMMNGFAATMAYSYHTSTYAKSAASNYASAVTKIADYSNMDIDVVYTGLGNLVNGTSDANEGTLYFASATGAQQAVSGVGSITLDCQRFKYNDGDSSVRNASNFGAYRSENVENHDTDGSFSNNRASYYYLPSHMGGPASTDTSHGMYRVYYNPTNKCYYWYTEDEVTDNGGAPAYESSRLVSSSWKTIE